MYIGLHVQYSTSTSTSTSTVQYPTFLSDFNETCIFSTDFRKILKIRNFTKNPSNGSPSVPCGQTWRRQYSLSAILRIRLTTYRKVSSCLFQQICTHPCNLKHVFADRVLCDFTAYTNVFGQCTHRRSHTAAHRNTANYYAWFVSTKMCHSVANLYIDHYVLLYTHVLEWHVTSFRKTMFNSRFTQSRVRPLLPVRWQATHCTITVPINMQYKSKQRPSSSAEAFRHPSRRQRRGQTNTWWIDPHSWFMIVRNKMYF